jgi:signal peptidase I
VTAAALGAWLRGRRRWLTVEVSGESMAPALEAGDWLVIRRLSEHTPRPEAGDVVLARDPSGRHLLKRAIGLPGEVVELHEDGVVHIDGRELSEPYAHGPTHPTSDMRALTRLGEHAYYLLGDNRGRSTDSRDHGAFLASEGPVSRPRVEGVAVLRYWPRHRIGWLRPEPRHFDS